MKTTILSYAAPASKDATKFSPELLTFCTKAQLPAGAKLREGATSAAEYGAVVFLTYSQDEGVVLLGNDKFPTGTRVKDISKHYTLPYRGYVELVCFD